jgi:hypothetical protein
MDLPLDAHKPGSLFVVGSATLLACPHKAQWLNLPNLKAKNSPHAIGKSTTKFKWQSCSEVLLDEEKYLYISVLHSK